METRSKFTWFLKSKKCSSLEVGQYTGSHLLPPWNSDHDLRQTLLTHPHKPCLIRSPMPPPTMETTVQHSHSLQKDRVRSHHHGPENTSRRLLDTSFKINLPFLRERDSPGQQQLCHSPFFQDVPPYNWSRIQTWVSPTSQTCVPCHHVLLPSFNHFFGPQITDSKNKTKCYAVRGRKQGTGPGTCRESWAQVFTLYQLCGFRSVNSPFESLWYWDYLDLGHPAKQGFSFPFRSFLSLGFSDLKPKT